MLNIIKNKIIVKLIKNTHISADVYLAIIEKTHPEELKNYLKIFSKTY